MIIKLKKILKNNHISNAEIDKYLNTYKGYLKDKLSLRRDFTINDLKLIKIYLVKNGIINDDYDYSDFLDLVEDD